MLSRLNRWQLRVKTILSLFSKLTWLLKQLNNFFVKLGQSRVLFLYFCLFNTVLIKLTVKKLPMTGFELRICGVGSNRSANFPTTRSLMNLLYVRLWTMCDFIEILSRCWTQFNIGNSIPRQWLLISYYYNNIRH